MNWNSIKLDDAKKDTLGGGLQSGGHTIDIDVTAIFRSPQSTFTQLTLEANVDGKKRFIKLTASGKDNKEGYDSKRIIQLLSLLKIDPATITEVSHDRANTFLIPQIKGKIGALIEVKPAFACKPNDKGDQYPELNIVQFYNHENGKTIAEESEGLPAKTIAEHTPKLLEKKYKKFGGAQQTSEPTSSQPVVDEDLLPY